jgi:hypothetical protein
MRIYIMILYSLPTTDRVNKLRRVSWVEHVVHGDEKCVQDFSLKIRKGRDCLGDLCVDGSMVLKQI